MCATSLLYVPNIVTRVGFTIPLYKLRSVPRPMYARKRIDISWWDLGKSLLNYFFWPQTAEQSEASLDELWSPKQTLATFTVRSGFDLCLQAFDFPPGSEVIVSAVTVPDMAGIIELHDLIPIPVDIQEDGSVLAEDVEALIGRKTKAILVAHLFGNRMPFEKLVSLARKRNLTIIEDCAEAFCGRRFTGSSGADISMFSFGAIKTSTALGGALMTVRDPELLSSMAKLQQRYSRQSTGAFVKKTAKYSFFKFLTDNSYFYGSFLAALKLLGINHHILIRKWSRSFRPENLLPQIRKRPSPPNLQLLYHRIRTFHYPELQKRKDRAERFGLLLPEISRPAGFGQSSHHYWLYPVQVPMPELLIHTLYNEGFDAADGGTSLAVVSTAKHTPLERANNIMRRIVYIPMDHIYDEITLRNLASIIRRHCEEGEALKGI